MSTKKSPSTYLQGYNNNKTNRAKKEKIDAQNFPFDFFYVICKLRLHRVRGDWFGEGRMDGYARRLGARDEQRTSSFGG